ncbi:unnamed protein product [Arabis nemorensis]|uniref:Pectinesterase catalytic domain-containing protein n=1 Tax=Arabis nemorensis TaxID=586526 RepID=A0A565ANL1_9BRAS|nr:unnamed protein product [Arabis nemorensis]
MFRSSLGFKCSNVASLIVAKDDKGKYETINDAVEAAPNYSKLIIFVKEGIYYEVVWISSTKTNITLGEGRDKTIITGSLNKVDNVDTFNSATLAVDGDGFIGQDICIRNTAGPEKHQAVALRVSGDNSILYLCGIEGYQDTLYADNRKQFYRECYITGKVDFICGDATAVFQKCHIEARKPLHGQENVITAQKRESQDDTNANDTNETNAYFVTITYSRRWSWVCRQRYLHPKTQPARKNIRPWLSV